MSLRSILVANRGEIACRVMRTARALGYRSVAVYSDADAQAPHVALADAAVHLGASPAAESYLAIDKVLAAARASGADAVHPGYGFLSERADFAQACTDAGLVFIGPPADAIRAMGDKAGAKRRMLAAGVPCAPGTLGDEQDDAALARAAQRLGVPLLVKAVAGGGGRGIRLVRDLAELPPALAGARREAAAAFGDPTLMLERLIEHGRHIEIQVFADHHGNVIHLGERDCSAQRRRQKLVEEAPSPVVGPALRERLGADAVNAARAVGYRGAGTVEFIVDAQMRHHFLEMNARLQVEHAVTECVTGVDLVEWQLRVAAGEPLPLTQDQVRCDGHAIEVRLCAEDPYAGFAPQSGPVLHWRPGQALQGRERGAASPGGGAVRIDSGIAEGGVVTPYYDPLVAKLIAHGRDRGDAIRRLTAVLEDAPLVGVRSNGRFLRDLLAHPEFSAAALRTDSIDAWAAQGEPLLRAPALPPALWTLAAAVLALRDGPAVRPPGLAAWDLTLQCGAERRRLRVRPHGRAVEVACDGVTDTVEVLSHAGHCLRWRQRGVQRKAVGVFDGAWLHLVDDALVHSFGEAASDAAADAAGAAADPRHARAAVAGTVVAVAVAAGDPVAAGQALVCVEAMKMELWATAGAAGRVAAVHVRPNDRVEAGAVLVELDVDPVAPPPAAEAP